MLLPRACLVLGIAVTAMASLGSPARADDQRRLARVSYADLNLTTPAGAQALGHRLRAAADQVCASQDLTATLKEQLDERRCRQAAVAGARHTLERRQLPIHPSAWAGAR